MIKAGDFLLNGIRIPESMPSPGRYAAEELQKYLLQITGENLPVRVDAPGEGRECCFVLECSAEGFAKEGFDRTRIYWRETDRSLVLCGENPISVLYAVYDFLKAFGGVRFYAPGSAFESVEACHEFILDPADFPVEFSSAVAVRDFVNRTNSHEVFSFAVKNRINSILGCGPWVNGSDQCSKVNAALIHSFGLKIRGPGHSWKHFVPDPALFAEHSEYFPLVNGKRIINGRTCCFSNPDARKVFMDNVRAYLKAHPYWDIFAFWAEDVPDMRYCDCEECRKKSTTEWYFLLCNEVAQILHEELPDAIFELIVYRGTANAPEKPFPFFLNGEKMLIDFCFNLSRDLYHPLAEEINANIELCDSYRKWRTFLQKSSFKGKMMLMEYYNLCEFPNSGPCGRALLWPLSVIRDDVIFYLKEGFNALGAFTGFDRLAFPTPLRLWTFLQLWSDPFLDLEALKQEFFTRYFGADSSRVMDYTGQFEKAMCEEVSEENLDVLKNCLTLLDGLEGKRIEILRVHHEYSVIVKKVFLAWSRKEKSSYEDAVTEWRSFPERHARILAEFTAPFPLLWYDFWCGSKIGWDRQGKWIELTEEKRKMWL